jgi:hypothetical protein
MFEIGDVLFWAACAITVGFMCGYANGFKDGKREGFIRGKVAARSSVIR